MINIVFSNERVSRYTCIYIYIYNGYTDWKDSLMIFYLEKIKTRMLLPFLEIIQNFFPDIFFLSTGTNNFRIIIPKLFPIRALRRDNLTRMLYHHVWQVDPIPPQGLRHCRLWCYHDVPINRPFHPNGICMYFAPLLLFQQFLWSNLVSFSLSRGPVNGISR